MRKNHTIILLLALLTFLFSGCEKDITLEFADYEPKIVVEGSIFEGEYPEIYLTRSSSYFDTLNVNELVTIELFGLPVTVPKYLYDMIVSDAVVIVDNGEIKDTLSLSFNPYYFPYLGYRGSKFLGESGKSYQLTILADGKTLTSTTTIPSSVTLDSLWFEPFTDNDSLGTIHAYFQEPKDQINYYRIFTKTENRDSIFVNPWFSIFDDKRLSDLDTVEIRIFHGNNNLDDPEDPFRSLFRLGESVRIKFCTMDYDHFTFWDSYQQSAGGGGNPFATPNEVKTNIENGLGVWGGYGVSYTDFLVILPDTMNNSQLKANQINDLQSNKIIIIN